MKPSRVALAGLVFGVSLVGGSAIAERVTSQNESDEGGLSADRLNIFTTAPDSNDRSLRISDIVGLPGLSDATIRYAGSALGIEVFLAEQPDGMVCIISDDPVGLGYTCGFMDDVARGEVVLGGQLREGQPVYWQGVLPNGDLNVSMDNVDVVQLDNVWVAVDEAAVGTAADRIVEIDDGSNVVEVSLSNPAAETSQSG